MIAREIRYPVARQVDGAPVHISQWQRDQEVTCFGCEKALVGRLPHDGIKPVPHFAHKREAACDGEGALHKAAKATIVQAHARGALDLLEWECPRCRWCDHQTDLAALVLRPEARPCDGVVSDVLGLDAAGVPRVAIEAVVTHPVAAETLARYRSIGILIVTIRPTWATIDQLMTRHLALRVEYLAGVVDEEACGGCQQLRREKLEWEDRERRRRARAWWDRLCDQWVQIGRQAVREAEFERLTAEARLLIERDRVDRWWDGWTRTWDRVARQRVDAWWDAWQSSWRTIATEHLRPSVWRRAWTATWEEIGIRFVADETASRRRRAEERFRAEEARRRDAQARMQWWPNWFRIWADIGDRASGLAAGRRPICPRCRMDMTPTHRCE